MAAFMLMSAACTDDTPNFVVPAPGTGNNQTNNGGGSGNNGNGDNIDTK